MGNLPAIAFSNSSYNSICLILPLLNLPEDVFGKDPFLEALTVGL